MTYSITSNDMTVLIQELKEQFEQDEKDLEWDFNDDEVEKDNKEYRKKAKAKRSSAGMCERIMDALCEDGRGDLLLLKDDEIREWWAGVIGRREQEARILAEQERRKRVREEALLKLTAEERELLGIK